MKKKLVASLLVMSMAFGMVACGNSKADDKKSEDGKTAISVVAAQYGQNTSDWWDNFVKDFNKDNPDIDLSVEVVSWNDISSVIDTRISGGKEPDILNIDVFADYQADDLLLPIQDVVSEETYNKMYPAFLEQSEIDGTVWAIPDLASARAMYYNKDILDAAGVEVPTTWDELKAACEKIKETNPDVYPWGIDMTTDEGQAAFSYYTWNNGGGFVDENGDWALNSEKNVEALNFAVGLVNDGYTNSDPANETRYDLQDMFGAGKVAMMIGPNNIPTYLSDGGYDINYDVTTIPANEGCESVAMGVCDRLEVFKDDSAEDQDARTAAITKFFDFFYDDERYADYMVYEGFLPTTQTAADLLAKDDDTFASWIDILQSCNFYPATKTEWADVKQGVIEVEQNALLGDDVQTLLDDLQADIAG